jgi:hypothetical protein
VCAVSIRTQYDNSSDSGSLGGWRGSARGMKNIFLINGIVAYVLPLLAFPSTSRNRPGLMAGIELRNDAKPLIQCDVHLELFSTHYSDAKSMHTCSIRATIMLVTATHSALTHLGRIRACWRPTTGQFGLSRLSCNLPHLQDTKPLHSHAPIASLGRS